MRVHCEYERKPPYLPDATTIQVNGFHLTPLSQTTMAVVGIKEHIICIMPSTADCSNLAKYPFEGITYVKTSSHNFKGKITQSWSGSFEWAVPDWRKFCKVSCTIWKLVTIHNSHQLSMCKSYDQHIEVIIAVCTHTYQFPIHLTLERSCSRRVSLCIWTWVWVAAVVPQCPPPWPCLGAGR